MAKLVIIASLLVAVLSLWFVLVQTGGDVSVAPPPPSRSVIIRHSFKDGVHRYTGHIRLPHSCYAVTTDIVQSVKKPGKLVIALHTKDNMLDYKLCAAISTRYPFEEVVDAPQDVTMMLTVDGVNTPVTIVESAWENPRGTILNLEN